MGSLFDSGPSSSDIARQEERAFQKEQERLRLAEMKLRRRESSETIQGQGVASTGNISIGTDLSTEAKGNEKATAVANPQGQTVAPIVPAEMSVRDKIMSGDLEFDFNGINLS